MSRTMLLALRSLSHPRRAPATALAGAAFALGVIAATAIGSASHIGLSERAASAASKPAPTLLEWSTMSATGYPADVIRVLDGDTFDARVRVWPGLEITTKVRLRGIDAPELRARCTEERIKAEAARDALAALLAQGRVGISQVSLDKYGGRIVAEASARNVANLSEALLAGGHVRRYGGGRREGWCSGRPLPLIGTGSEPR
ncbi:MAG: nuclease [Rhizobiales bacterium]|nr:nuclease [Hyphomicrobiales bacterium]